MTEEQQNLDLGDVPPAAKAIGEAYHYLSNTIIQLIMGATGNDPVLSHAVATTVEARLRALNHYNLVTKIIDGQDAKRKQEEMP